MNKRLKKKKKPALFLGYGSVKYMYKDQVKFKRSVRSKLYHKIFGIVYLTKYPNRFRVHTYSKAYAIEKEAEVYNYLLLDSIL